MTLAVLGKVPSGFILATDRIEVPSKISVSDSFGEQGASKIFLSPERPLGALVWGAGGLGASTLSEIAARIENPEGAGQVPMHQIAHDLPRFLAQQSRRKFSTLRPYLRPRLGFFLAGFETEGEAVARDWVWEMTEPFSPPRPVRSDRPDEPPYGFNWRGQELWMTRLILGYDPFLLDLLESQLAIPRERLLPLFRKVEMPISYSGMDTEQAMQMAAYMIHTTLALLHLQTYPRNWKWEIEMAIITPQGARRVPSSESQGSEEGGR